jgi:hypothetical protein
MNQDAVLAPTLAESLDRTVALLRRSLSIPPGRRGSLTLYIFS